MKNSKTMLSILLVLLVSACGFSQNSQPDKILLDSDLVQPIQLDSQDGVFITLGLMDAITLKMIDRNVLKKEVLTLNEIVSNVKNQNKVLNLKFDLSVIQSENYIQLWKYTETQKDKLFAALEQQKTITKNVKKKPLETVFYISEEVSRSVLLSSSYWRIKKFNC